MDETVYVCFKWKGIITTHSCSPLQLIYKFIYPDSNISSTESDFNIHLVKKWTAIDRLTIIWMSHRIDLIVAVSILRNGFTSWTLTKSIEKNWMGTT